jgi:hypothetical protein
VIAPSAPPYSYTCLGELALLATEEE